MKIKIIFFILFSSYFFNIINSLNEPGPYLLFPFKKYFTKDNKYYYDESSELIKQLIPNNIYLTLKITSFQIQLNAFITFSQSFFSIGEENCLLDNKAIFPINNSTSYKFISNITLATIDRKTYEQIAYFQENVIYSNTTNEIKIENMDCFHYINNAFLKCSILGLDLNRDKTQQNFFTFILKHYSNNIKNSYLSIIFKNDSNIFIENQKNNIYNTNNGIDIDGEILLGIPPHEYYKNEFFEQNLIEINTQCSRDQLSWIIRFDSVYTEDTINNSINYFTFTKKTYYDYDQYFGVFFPEINPIYVPRDIFEYYIDNYFDKYLNKECLKKGRPLYNKYLTTELFKSMQIFIYCNKTKIKDISKFYNEFPSLNLKNTFFKEIFSFKGKELFTEDSENTYFILLPEFSNNNKFLLGKIFMSKYQFTFNYDTKTIGYYNKNISNAIKTNNETRINNSKNEYLNHNLFLIFIIIFLLFIILGIYYLGKLLYRENKEEKQALELSYMKKEDDNKKKEIAS